jgi:hypothetical protein
MKTLLKPEEIDGRPNLIGYSLSFCISDIIHGRVALSQVWKINAQTRVEDEHVWQELIEHYCETYWKGKSEQAVSVLKYLKERGMIEQPRLKDPQINWSIVDGWWEVI